MRRFQMSASAMAVLILALSFCSAAYSAGGRDFAGFYALTDAAQAGQNYTVTFTARVFNYSGAGVTGATLLLRGCPSPGAPCSSFSNIDIGTSRPVQLSTKIAIPAAVYAHWQHGGRPELEIEFTAPDGEKHSERVELMFDHGGAQTHAD